MLFLGYAVFSAALWAMVTYSVRSAVDDSLSQRLERLVQVVATEADGPAEVEEDLTELVLAGPEGHLAQIRDSENRQVFPQTAAQAPAIRWEDNDQERVFRTVHTDDALYRVLVQEVVILGQTYRVLLASSLESLLVVRDRLAASFLVATPIALVLCAVGGLYTARRALRPVDRLSETASEITVGNLSKRIPVPETGDALERLSRTFNEMLERLEASVARIEQFSADASHELRTPLSVIRTTAELALRHGRSEDGYRADLRDIHAESQRLSELIEVLLTLSRAGLESRSVPMSDVNLSALASEVCRQFRPEAESKGLNLRLDTPEGSAVVVGSEPTLRRLLASLLENALAHTQAGNITVSVVHEKEGLELTVKDTGEGIPPEALGKIFDRFYRVDSVRSPSSGRLGLGLSIAKRIAELHDAELSAESEMGKGSCFKVRFRRHQEGGAP